MSGKPTVISTFAGCGGSSLGYKWAGFKELLAIEWEENAVETFKLNFPDVPVWKRDIRKVTGKEILEFTGLKKGELDVFDGSPPCQGFSTAGKRKVNDDRNDLSYEFIRLINELQPKVFVMENVSGMVKGKMKGSFKEIMKALKATGYNVKCKLMNAMHYEVPQSRQRLIWIGVKNGEPIYPEPLGTFISSSKAFAGYKGRYDAPLTECSRKYWPLLNHGESASKYHPTGGLFGMIKLHPYKPSPTILKSCGNPICHYSEPRFLDEIELKRLSSFPDDFIFVGKIGKIRDRIGNAVMPKFMYHIAKTIKTEILNHAKAEYSK